MTEAEIENTDDWLGCPTPLETCQHQLRLYENEFDELNLQLREARERIFKLVDMHAEAISERDEAKATLREKAAETAKLRKSLYDLNITARGYQREVNRLRGMLDGLTPNTKTIV
ncbi:hypothetical protein ACIOUG_01235 [Pseudomonas sp. NPDC087803]|uniref:hypothetical protein n=1 Tax=Pseudomonas sp. NPDC087803 TaxID=3364448 RepID=UPI00382B5925